MKTWLTSFRLSKLAAIPPLALLLAFAEDWISLTPHGEGYALALATAVAGFIAGKDTGNADHDAVFRHDVETLEQAKLEQLDRGHTVPATPAAITAVIVAVMVAGYLLR